jgi:hypothetical protein
MDIDALLHAHYTAVATGDADLAHRAISSDWRNAEASHEPPACATPGPAGLMATSAWLRLAFGDLHFEPVATTFDGETAMSLVTLTGRQHGPFVTFADGRADTVFPPTGRTFEMKQFHLHRVRDGLCTYHEAVRDDLGLMLQLGHLPPTPAVAMRLFRSRISGAARRAAREAVDRSALAARDADAARA